MKLVLGILSALIFVSCTHKPPQEEPRQPASDKHHHVSDSELQEISEMVKSQDYRALNLILRETRTVQALASAFDARLGRLKDQADADRLMSSQLYCNILTMRTVQEKADDKIRHAFELSRNNTASRQWMLKMIAQFSAEGPKSEAAMIQVLRTLRPLESEVCGAEGCLEKELKPYKFNVAPFDDDAFAAFMKKHRREIAKFAGPRSSDMNPGACFGDVRLPSQATATYDWKNRNWVGGVLPEGTFVVTYDDGPDDRYTRAIRDTWAKAGLAKPAFFWLGKQAKRHPDIVREFQSQGYLIGSHSYNHPDMANLIGAASPSDFNSTNRKLFEDVIPTIRNFREWKAQQVELEIAGSLKELESLTGQHIRYFRLPYGSGVRNDVISNYFQKMNIEHFFWRVDSLDWQDKNPVSIRDRVLQQMRLTKKGIILFHDIHPQSLKASELLVQYFKSNPQLKVVPLNQIPGLEQK